MKLIINKDRTTVAVGTWGTVNENNYEILDFEFPAELEHFNKRIVYYLGDERVWDAIVGNKAYITNAITKKEHVKAYVWLTERDDDIEKDIDFRTQLFEMNFYENENADGIVPTEEQVDGFNTMLTAMNEKIEEINELETTIENAETTRQEHEETRQENESTRQENEQTRQEQEAERERRTDEAIGEIEDLTEAYNQNAQQKTEAFNNNATQKTDAFNQNAESKTTTFNNNASSKTSDFNTNATNKTNAFDSNASSKTTSFNNNATSKTTDFNTNAENKTTAFNSNATDKTTNFDNNANSKTTTFNENATSKTNDFNDNATAKTTAYNENAQAKIDEYDAHIVDYQAQIDDLTTEVQELSENMPWSTTEQSTEIRLDDAAKYSKNKLELFGNTEQMQYTGKNLLDTSANNTTLFAYFDGQTGELINDTTKSNCIFNKYIEVKPDTSYTISSKEVTNYTIYGVAEYNESKEFIQALSTGNTHPLAYTFTTAENTKYIRARYKWTANTEITNDIIEDKKIQIEEGAEATDYEPYTGGVPSPSPDYPQDIHVVTGNNTIEVQGKNLIDAVLVNDTSTIQNTEKSTNLLLQPGTYTIVWFNKPSTSNANLFSGNNVISVAQVGYYTNKRTFEIEQPTLVTKARSSVNANETVYCFLVKGTIAPETYTPYYHADYPINLGSIELCKIGDYQDYLYKENGNWYKYGAIDYNVATGASTEQWTWTLRNENKAMVQSTKIGQCIDGRNFIAICSNSFRGTHGNDVFSSTNNNVNIIGCAEQSKIRIAISPSDFADINAFKNFLQENNLEFYFVLATPNITQITDATLIAQLDAIYEHLQLVKGTNNITVTASDSAPNMQLSYMQDLPARLDKLASRIELLEE